MARDFATAFYNCARWKKVQRQVKARAYGLCEICGKPGKIAHHEVILTPDNIDDPFISLNLDFLIYVCLDCHNRIHSDQSEQREIEFDSNGNLVQMETADYSQYIMTDPRPPR